MVLAACGSGTTVTLAGHLTDSVVHLKSGDSVEFQSTGPAVVPTGTGLVVTYRPYFSLDDTARVRGVALEFFWALLPRITTSPPFVVMRAIDVPAARRNQGGYYEIHTFGVVLERHADGQWYGMGEVAPILRDST